jgi:hypothetical protein
MQRYISTLVFAILTNCTNEPPRDFISDATREALAQLGVDNVRLASDSYILEGRNGQRGQVQFTTDKTTITSWNGHELRTHVDEGSTTTECNGAGVSFTSDHGSISNADIELLKPCDEAARITSLVVGMQTAPASTQNLCEDYIESGCVEWTQAGGCITYQACWAWICDDGWGHIHSDFICETSPGIN